MSQGCEILNVDRKYTHKFCMKYTNSYKLDDSRNISNLMEWESVLVEITQTKG